MYDTGGLIDTPLYDFKGQPVSTTRRLFKKYKEVANWTDANLVNDLEPDSFIFSTETDALGRLESAYAGNLQISTKNRLPHSSNTPGKLPGDHAGHLSRKGLGGPPGEVARSDVLGPGRLRRAGGKP